jgi:5'-nucleotidase
MADLPANLADLRILLTNDDGIEAEGLKLLERLVRQFTQNVWVCAPAENQSAKSHSYTHEKPVILKHLDEHHFAVAGTPVDSVILGVDYVMREHKPDLILSGINHGRNLADDIVYSGTVAAAREATILGFHAIAFSQERQSKELRSWVSAEQSFARLFPYLIGLQLPEYTFLNVNFPHTLRPDYNFEIVRHGRYTVYEESSQLSKNGGEIEFRFGTKVARQETADDIDASAIARGNISITPLNVDTTAHGLLKALPPYRAA